MKMAQVAQKKKKYRNWSLRNRKQKRKTERKREKSEKEEMIITD